MKRGVSGCREGRKANVVNVLHWIVFKVGTWKLEISVNVQNMRVCYCRSEPVYLYPRQTAMYLGPSRGLYANKRPMVSGAVLLESGRSGIDRLQVYLSPVVLEVESWCETIEAGRKVGRHRSPCLITHSWHVSNRKC
jgi:hypothetical protein